VENKRSILITGANGGLGRELLRVFAAAGFDIIATVRNLEIGFSDWCEELAGTAKNRIVIYEVDLVNAEEAQHKVRNILSEHPDLTDVINNAAVPYGATVLMTPFRDLRKVFEVNFFSAIAISQVFAKHLIRVKVGSITNITSISTSVTLPGMLAYGTSKAALEYATGVFAQELGNSHIKVRSVAIGLMETHMAKQMSAKSLEELGKQGVSRLIPPREVAAFVLSIVKSGEEESSCVYEYFGAT